MRESQSIKSPASAASRTAPSQLQLRAMETFTNLSMKANQFVNPHEPFRNILPLAINLNELYRQRKLNPFGLFLCAKWYKYQINQCQKMVFTCQPPEWDRQLQQDRSHHCFEPGYLVISFWRCISEKHQLHYEKNQWISIASNILLTITPSPKVAKPKYPYWIRTPICNC